MICHTNYPLLDAALQRNNSLEACACVPGKAARWRRMLPIELCELPFIVRAPGNMTVICIGKQEEERGSNILHDSYLRVVDKLRLDIVFVANLVSTRSPDEMSLPDGTVVVRDLLLLLLMLMLFREYE